MPPTHGFPEVTKADLDPTKPPFRLNSLLKLLAEQIARVQGNSGASAMGTGPFSYKGRVSMDGGASVAGDLTVTAETDTNGNYRALRFPKGLSEYANDAAARAGGLVPGDWYRTATGQVMIVLPLP